MTRPHPRWLDPADPRSFPDPASADREGLVAVGGDLSRERLLAAYEQGIFPWYDAGLPPLWWSPDPRAILPLPEVHVSRSLRRLLRQRRFRITWNRAFERVVEACATERDGGTWILPEMAAAYGVLHAHGEAYSLEVWDGAELAGGLYGVHRGGLFAAESMFHRRSNASKVALVVAAASLHAAGVELFDVQLPTDHLESMGVVTISRKDYLKRLTYLVKKPLSLARLELEMPS